MILIEKEVGLNVILNLILTVLQKLTELHILTFVLIVDFYD